MFKEIYISEYVKSKGLEGVTGRCYCDTEAEFNEAWTENHNNPDFSYIGDFDMLQDLDDELQGYGFSPEEIAQLSLNRYGHVLDVLEFEDKYYAFMGARQETLQDQKKAKKKKEASNVAGTGFTARELLFIT